MSRIQASKSDLVSLALLGGTFAVTAAIYEKLPARIPTHFGIHGQADGWSSRAFGAWFLPVIALLVWALVRFGGKIAGPLFRERLEASPVKLVALLTVAFMSALHFVMLWSALHESRGIGGALGIALGLFWIVLAQVMPRVRRNPFVGVRTAWTLSSDENWARTHRFAGWTFTVGGLVALFAALAGVPAVALCAIVVSGLVPALYSWMLARRLT
ncbi:MAG: SdpI family protein [Polyangiales bacterium]